MSVAFFDWGTAVPQWMMVVENGGLRWIMVVGWGTAVDDGGWLGDCGG